MAARDINQSIKEKEGPSRYHKKWNGTPSPQTKKKKPKTREQNKGTNHRRQKGKTKLRKSRTTLGKKDVKGSKRLERTKKRGTKRAK